MKKIIHYKQQELKESLREMELNRILDKISKRENLSKKEEQFLNLYNQTREEDYKDYHLLSKILACDKIIYYINKDKKVWCDVCDKFGKLNDIIIKVYKSSFTLFLKNGEYIMRDNFLYNITFNIKRNDYTLTEQDQYYEEIEIDK